RELHRTLAVRPGLREGTAGAHSGRGRVTPGRFHRARRVPSPVVVAARHRSGPRRVPGRRPGHRSDAADVGIDREELTGDADALCADRRVLPTPSRGGAAAATDVGRRPDRACLTWPASRAPRGVPEPARRPPPRRTPPCPSTRPRPPCP